MLACGPKATHALGLGVVDLPPHRQENLATIAILGGLTILLQALGLLAWLK